jgi:hypothetical protein
MFAHPVFQKSTTVMFLLEAHGCPVAHPSLLFEGSPTTPIQDWEIVAHTVSPFLEQVSFHLDLCRKSMKSCNVRVRVCWVRNSMTCASVQSIALWRVEGHVWNWGCRSQSSGILDGVVRSICAIWLLECSRISRPSPQAVILCSSVSFIVHFLQVSVCTILIRWRRSFVGIKSWMTRNQAIRVDSGTGAALRLTHMRAQFMCSHFFITRISWSPAIALVMVCIVM